MQNGSADSRDDDDRAAVTGDSDVDQMGITVPQGYRLCLADANEGRGKILIVPYGDDAVHGQHGHRCILAGPVQRLGLGGACCSHGIDDLTYAKGF